MTGIRRPTAVVISFASATLTVGAASACGVAAVPPASSSPAAAKPSSTSSCFDAFATQGAPDYIGLTSSEATALVEKRGDHVFVVAVNAVCAARTQPSYPGLTVELALVNDKVVEARSGHMQSTTPS